MSWAQITAVWETATLLHRGLGCCYHSKSRLCYSVRSIIAPACTVCKVFFQGPALPQRMPPGKHCDHTDKYSPAKYRQGCFVILFYALGWALV